MRILAAAVILFLAGLEALSFSGFCFSQYRWLSRDEVMTLAVRSQADRIKELTYAVVRYGNRRGVRASDEDIAKYIESHPHCCAIASNPFNDQSYELINCAIGAKPTWVHLLYALPDEEGARAPRDGSYYTVHVRVSPCGKTRGEAGMTLTSDEYERAKAR